MQVKFYPKDKKANDTCFFAQIAYQYNRPKIYFSDLKFNAAKYWDHKKQRVKDGTVFVYVDNNTKKSVSLGAYEFNQRLESCRIRIYKCFNSFLLNNEDRYPTPAELKKLLLIEFKKKLPAAMAREENLKSFWGYFQHFIDQSINGIRKTKQGEPVSKNTISNYNTVFAVLQEFEKHRGKKITFDCIDLDFYGDFVHFLERIKKYRKNTIQTTVRVLKTVMGESMDEGYHQNKRYASKKFTAAGDEVTTVYLNEDELRELYTLDLSANQRLEKVRDLFLVSCFTGLRFSDIHQVKAKNITPDPLHPKDLYLTIRQVKTNDEVVIPINSKVNKLLQKYNNELPEPISNQKTNEFLKEICQRIESLKAPADIQFVKGGLKVSESSPKWQLITTHTARRSFATNAYLAGHQVKNIMAVTGHKTEKSFYKYIRVTAMEKARLFKQHSEAKLHAI